MNELEEAINAIQNAISRAEHAEAGGALLQKTDLMNILSLLKAQEARLLTKEEIISWEGYIWKEFKGKTAMKALLIDHGMEREPYIGNFPTNSYLWDNYNQYWRCWSTQPTKEQREAVKWNE